MRTKLVAGLAVATVTLGAGGAAFAADSGTATTPDPAKVAERCEKLNTLITTKAPAAFARIDAGKGKLNDAIAKATAAGKTARAERLQARLAKLGDRETKLQGRLAKAKELQAQKCSTPG